MCELCVKEEYPDRDTLCVEKGSYMINFKKCSQCGQQSLTDSNRSCMEENEEELITYQHICSNCDHLIAQHDYVFKVEGAFQIYEMTCLLCGTAEDQRSIMPVDSRGPMM